MKITLTLEERQSFRDKNQEEINLRWVELGRKYSFNPETVRTEEGFLVANPIVESKELPKESGEVIHKAVLYPEDTLEIKKDDPFIVLAEIVKGRDELVAHLKKIQVTNHEERNSAMNEGNKARTLVVKIEEAVKIKVEPILAAHRNWKAFENTIKSDVVGEMSVLANKIKVFDDAQEKLRKESEAAALKAIRDNEILEEKKAKAGQEKKAEVDVFIKEFDDEMIGKPKEEIKKLLADLKKFNPNKENWGESYDYLMSEFAKLINRATVLFETGEAVPEADDTKEKEFKQDLISYLKILGVKEIDLEQKSLDFKMRFGSYEMAHGNRQIIRQEHNDRVELKNKETSSTTVSTSTKGRRKTIVHQIVDESLIPREYLVCDEKKIKAAMKLYDTKVQDGSFTIPGVLFVEETKTQFKKQ